MIFASFHQSVQALIDVPKLFNLESSDGSRSKFLGSVTSGFGNHSFLHMPWKAEGCGGVLECSKSEVKKGAQLRIVSKAEREGWGM